MGGRNTRQGTQETIKKLEDTIRRLSTSVHREKEQVLFPVQPKSTEAQLTLLSQVLPKLREILTSKSLTLPQAFSLFDPEQLGLIAFPTFSRVLSSLLPVSVRAQDQLFAKMDRLKIGLICYQEFKRVINADDVGLRLLNKERQVEDSFEWEQAMIRRILDWIVAQRMSLSEGFKMMDCNFDGVVTLPDLASFLKDTFGVDTTA